MPQVLILTTLPILMGPFMSSLDWRNVVFSALMFPIVTLIWLPFFKIYERQCIENEQAAELEASFKKSSTKLTIYGLTNFFSASTS